MTGPELRALMKLRRIRTAEAARSLGIHPQTIRNLWHRDEVPKLYLMALTTYVWALGMDPKITRPEVDDENPEWTKDDFARAKKPDPSLHVKMGGEWHKVKTEPPSVRTEVRGAKIPGVPVAKNEEKPIEKKESIWSKLS